jgi:hypothetical protein
MQMLLDASHVLETPWPVLTAAIILLAIIVLFRQSWPDKRRWWQLLVPVILAVVGVGLEHLFKTDYEKIASVIDSGIQAVIDRDIGQINRIISPDYSDSRHHSKDAIMAFCGDLLSERFAEKIKKQQEKITILAPEATAELLVRLHLSPQNTYAAMGTLMYVKIKLYFTKTTHGNWLISGTEIVSVNNQTLNWNSVI